MKHSAWCNIVLVAIMGIACSPSESTESLGTKGTKNVRMADFEKTPEEAAERVVIAILAKDWTDLESILNGNPTAVGDVTKWQRPEGPPQIAGKAEVQKIPELMQRYPGRTLVRFDIPNEPKVYKLEVVVEEVAGAFRAIDFWGLGW